LLFEGAWNVEVSRLLADWPLVLLLAVPGLLVAVAIAALGLHWGAGLPWLVALLLSTIISPTDPVAVIALMRQLGMSSRLRTIIEGESLFNDGMATATFIITLDLLAMTFASNFHGFTGGQIDQELVRALWLFLGGVLLGGLAGWLVSRFLRHIEDRLIETAITFITAYGVYLAADLAHASGILAVVVAGLILGSYGRQVGISHTAHEAVDSVWEFLSYVATSLLFLLLGVELSRVTSAGLAVIFWATISVIVGRAILVYGATALNNAFAVWAARRPNTAWTPVRPVTTPSAWPPILLLSGLRGALSIVLVLSLPASTPHLAEVQDAVYGVTLVTLLGQGIALRFLLPRWPGVQAATHIGDEEEGPDAERTQALRG
jgi:CPA1 family monovalent cation:H+ antiporter